MTSETAAVADSPGSIYRWIERKPLTEAVSWTSREKFWLITATCHYGTHDWRSVAQVVRNAGEPYRPREWYTYKNCERQFKFLVSSLSKDVKSLPFSEMLQHIANSLRNEYMRDANKSKDSLKTKYCNLFSVLNRVKQGNLSRNEVVSLYSQARRNEIEGKQYLEQLMTRQNATLASENCSSGSSDEPIKWNTPSAPLLTSLLRSRNTIPANRTASTIASLLQSPAGTSRTRSGKLLPLSSNIRTSQGTPTLSKLLEAPANPYIPSPPQVVQKNKPSEAAGSDKFVGSISRKENTQSTSLNRIRMENSPSPGTLNMANRAESSVSKKQLPKSLVSTAKNGSKTNSNNSCVVNLLSDSENDEDNKTSSPDVYRKNSLGEKKETIFNINSRLEPRTTRSQTRAEGGFKQLNDDKLSQGKKDQETQQQSEASQMTETETSLDDDLIDIDQIEIEPLSSVQEEIITHTSPKITRSSMQKLKIESPRSSLLMNKVNTKEISNQMLEEISANFVLHSKMKNIGSEYKNVMVGQSQINSSNKTGCFIPIDSSAIKDGIILRKSNESFTKPGLSMLDIALQKNKKILTFPRSNLKCFDTRNNQQLVTFKNPSLVVINNVKTPPSTREKMLSDESEKLNVSVEENSSFDEDVIVIDDDDTLSNNNSSETQNSLLEVVGINESPNISDSSKSITSLPSDEKKTKNDKALWDMFEKTQNSSPKKSGSQSIPKTGATSVINNSSNSFIKELDFDFDQSISQTSLSELCNEEIVEMHTFDNEELNSLIECGSLDSSGAEERQSEANLDQGESSVSENDSTIGAFDTFAQITRVPQKSSPKNNQSVNRELKTVKHDEKESEHDESSVQCEEVDDDRSSSALSVTGIPILQGVISDVMNEIDSERNVALKPVESDHEVVEISSGEENENDSKQVSLNVNTQNVTQNVENEMEATKSNEVIIVNEADDESKVEAEEIEIDVIDEPITINEPVNVNITSSKIRESLINKTLELRSMIAKKELELQNASKKELEMKLTENIEDKLTKTDTVNDLKECKVKTNTSINAEENSKNEDSRKQKEENEKMLKEAEINKKKKDQENKLKELGAKELAALKAKEIEIKKACIAHIIQNKQEPEIKLIRSIDTREIEKLIAEKAAKSKREAELKRAKEAKMKEAELKKAKKSEMKKPFEAELSQRAKEAEIKKAVETEARKAKEAEIKKEKDAEIKRAKEEEIRKEKEAEIKKAKEAEMKKAIEAETRKSKEAEVKKAKEADIKRAREIELRKAEEAETRKAKEVERRKAETEIKEKDKMAKMKEDEFEKIKEKETKEVEIKRVKEAEFRKRIEEGETNSQKEDEHLSLKEQLKRAKEELELSNCDFKKINVTDHELKVSESKSEITKSKEQQLKLIEVENRKVKTHFKTKGLNVEDKQKETSPIVSKVTSKSSFEYSPTCSTVEIPSTSNNDNKKSNKYVGNNRKLSTSVTSSKTVFDDHIRNRDTNICSNSSIVKENIQSDVGGKSKTRSSIRDGRVLETKITSIEQNKDDTCVKSFSNVPSDNNSNKRISDCATTSNKFDDLASNRNQHPDYRQASCSHSNNELRPRYSVDTSEKLSLNKRGRKRQIDSQNSPQTLSRRVSGELIPVIDLCQDDVEPIVKRTKINDEPQESEDDHSDQSSDDDISPNHSMPLKFVYSKLCLKKYIETVDTPDDPFLKRIVRFPMLLKDIKSKIETTEIGSIEELQLNLMLMSYNTVMTNPAGTSSVKEATDLQVQLKYNCRQPGQKDYFTDYFDSKRALNAIKKSVDVKNDNSKNKSEPVNDQIFFDEDETDIIHMDTDDSSVSSDSSIYYSATDDEDSLPVIKKRKLLNPFNKGNSSVDDKYFNYKNVCQDSSDMDNTML